MHVQKDGQWSSELGRGVGDEAGGTAGAQLGGLRRLGDIGCHGEKVFAHSAMTGSCLRRLLHREWRGGTGGGGTAAAHMEWRSG